MTMTFSQGNGIMEPVN